MILYSGNNPCVNITCPDGSHCKINVLGISECLCPEPPLCEASIQPVCGTDGITYESKCHLNRVNCISKLDVKIAYEGPCGKNYINEYIFIQL